MDVTAIDVFLSASADRRARICRRSDGRFQYVTERLEPQTDEFMGYWINDYPPSGVFQTQDDARSALIALMPSLHHVPGTKSVTFNINVGPYPEPESREG